MNSDLGPHSRGSVEDVYAVPGITFDLDLHSWGIHKQDNLPHRTDAAFRFIESLVIPQPTAWIHSGNGLYPRWHLEHLFIIDDDEAARERIKSLTQGWHAYIRQQALEKHGWRFDNTGDLARLTRHPGTYNHKTLSLVKPVELLHFDPGQTYSTEELEAVLGDVMPEQSASVGSAAPATTVAQSSSAPPAWKQHCLGLKPGSDKNFESVYEGCGWMRQAVDDAASLGEPEWYAALSISARCANGEKLSHDISQPYGEYSPRETDQKIKKALDNAGPRTCAYIQQTFLPDACKACAFKGQINTPLQLAETQPQAVELMKQYVYVIKTCQFVERSTLYSYSEKGFNSCYAHWHLKDGPANSLLRSPACRKVQEIGYDPGNPDRLVMMDNSGVCAINTWQAPSIKGSAASPDWLIQHLRFLIPNQTERDHVLNVLAHVVQKPSIKIDHGLIIIGKQGTGKSFLGSLMRRLLGSSNVARLTSDDIESRWNANIANHVLAIIEEMMAGDRMAAYNRMKPWLSDETMQCEEKHVPRYEAKTPRFIIGLSNYQTPTKIGNDDRRWFVVNSTAEPQNGVYYDELWKRLDSDYEMGGVLHHLLERDLSHFSPKARPPMTQAKVNLAEDSRTPVAQAIQDLIADEAMPFNRDLVRLKAIEAALAGKQLGGPVTPHKIKVALQEIGAENLGQKDLGPRHGKARLWVWRNQQVWREATPLQMRQHLDNGSVSGREKTILGP